MVIRRYLLLVAALGNGTLRAGELELKPDTLKAWDEYVLKATAAMQRRVQSGGPFLWMDESKDRRARVRSGEIVVWPAGESNPKRVAAGLIHDWMGAVFIPNVRID